MDTTTLQVSFYGPFVFGFFARRVSVYAPQCHAHDLFVQSDYTRLLLNGRSRYTSSNDTYLYTLQASFDDQCDSAVEAEAVRRDPVEIIRLDWQTCTSSDRGPSPKTCYWQLDLPRPHHHVGLLGDYISVDQSMPSSPPFEGYRATAMRFYYHGFQLDHGLQLYKDLTGSPLIDTQRDPFEVSQGHVPVTFRYSSNELSDADHRDAEECFGRMREMFPPLDTWNVSFEVPLELEEPKMVHKSGDCGAAQIIFATLEDLERWRIVGAK